MALTDWTDIILPEGSLPLGNNLIDIILEIQTAINSNEAGDSGLAADVASNTAAAAANTSANALDLTHRTGDGSDHADVATNTAHSTGDGSDHADVATNTAHGAASNGVHGILGEVVGHNDVQTLENKTLLTYDESGDTPTISSGVLAFARADGPFAQVVLTENVTSITVDDWGASGKLSSFTFELIQAAGLFTVAFPAGWRVNGGTPPTMPAVDGQSLYCTLVSFDGGTTVTAFFGGDAIS